MSSANQKKRRYKFCYEARLDSCWIACSTELSSTAVWVATAAQFCAAIIVEHTFKGVVSLGLSLLQGGSGHVG